MLTLQQAIEKQPLGSQIRYEIETLLGAPYTGTQEQKQIISNERKAFKQDTAYGRNGDGYAFDKWTDLRAESTYAPCKEMGEITSATTMLVIAAVLGVAGFVKDKSQGLSKLKGLGGGIIVGLFVGKVVGDIWSNIYHDFVRKPTTFDLTK